MVMLNLIEKFLNRMTNRQDDKSPTKDITGWKYDNNPTSPHNKISPNSNLPYKNTFFADDSCSNDFFYDEEFTVPFDANLTDQRDESFLPRHNFGIVTSKSDNCLYVGDVNHLESDQESSESEQEIFSSSDSSELFNQPLFSSHSECPDEFALDGSDNEASVIDDFPKDVPKPTHIKHHYKISFDRGPLKVWSSSDEPASKVSLELKPKLAHKPNTLAFKQNGVTTRSSNFRKPASMTRKSKKKSQKNGMTWNSKSSHQETWAASKNSPTNSEGNKPRTSWKEMNIKPNVPMKEVQNKIQSNVESCRETNFDQKSEKDDGKVVLDDSEESQAKPQMNTKSCELFKIFQDKKLKEVEEIIDDYDCHKALKSPQFCLHENEAPICKNEDEKSDLEGIFEDSNKSERKLKFKSHSIEPNNSSPVQECEKSPKIVQSANLASTTSTDSSVQTSLIISIPVKTENKSLQTSFAEEKPQETSGRDIWNTSSYLFSRPLPDLSFLKNSSKFMEPVQKVDSPSVKQPKSVVKEEAKSHKKSNPQNNKSSFKQTFTKSKPSNNSKTSQESSSGRSKSSSSFSFHSSSSSGIDPGTSDSGRQSSSASSKDESSNSDLKTPPKPPRLFKTTQPADISNNGSSVKDDEVKNNSKNVEACKEQNTKISTEVKNARNFVRTNNHQNRRSFSHDKSDPPPTKTSKVVLRNSQPGYAQPTKSILVRSRSKENRRSWSINLQSNESRSTNEHSSPRKRPLSVPDGTLLEMTTPTQEEEKPSEDKNIVCADNDNNSTVEADDKSHSKEDGNNNNNNVAVTTTSEHDYEKFRAKKSVSFSETISYHPTTSSLSPLESPKSPVNSIPNSPDVDAARDVAKESCPDATHDATEDLELPPNDFLVSPNISPASSLTDSSSSNLYPLNFDLQQKKDLVMDVIKAVGVVFKHVNRVKDPLGRTKLCSTVDNPKMGNLLLEHLCPSIHAIVLDGIKPSVPGLFGKVKSSACKVFEDSLEGSPFDSLNHLMKSMKDLKFLNNPWLKFNAYLFALLNLKVLDMWLASLRKNRSILSRYYTTTSFLHLSSSSTCQPLFHEVVAALQPLCQFQFRLEYDFEVNIVERKRQAFIAEQLLNKHVSCSSEVQAETESYLSRMHNNTFSLDSSSPVGKVPKHPTLSLDEKMTNKNRDAAEENSSLFLLWSSVDFGGLARGFLQKTQNKLIEKLSQSKDMFSFEGSPIKVDKPQNGGSLNESSMQQKLPRTNVPHLPPQMTRSDCPRPCPEFSSPSCEVLEKIVIISKPTITHTATPQTTITHTTTPQTTITQTTIPQTTIPTHKINLQPSPLCSSQPPKSQTGLLSSYGSKIVGVFDRLLLNDSDKKVFLVRKKYHSEDQISRHVSNDDEKQSSILAKSVEGGGVVPSVQSSASMLVASCSSRFRIARSLCHYVAMNNQFLSFEKDVEMTLVKEVGHDFFLCRLKDDEGLVYKVCVAIVR